MLLFLCSFAQHTYLGRCRLPILEFLIVRPAVTKIATTTAALGGVTNQQNIYHIFSSIAPLPLQAHMGMPWKFLARFQVFARPPTDFEAAQLATAANKVPLAWSVPICSLAAELFYSYGELKLENLFCTTATYSVNSS